MKPGLKRGRRKSNAHRLGFCTAGAAIESGDIGLAWLPHGQRNLTSRLAAHKQMHVVAHQKVGVNFQAMFRGALTQHTPVVAAVVVVQKNGAPIYSALRDVQRYPGYFEARLARLGRGQWPKCPRVVNGSPRNTGAAIRSTQAQDGLRSVNFLRPGYRKTR